MRILDFSDGFTSETAPTQGTTTTTQLATFANDAAFVTSKGSAASSGDTYFNTTSNTGRMFDGSNWLQIFQLNSDGTATFTGDATFNTDVTITGNLTVNGDTVTLNTTTWEVEDTNITLNKNGNQATADDTAGITIEMSDATDAKIIYDKDVASKWKVGESGSEEEVLTAGHTQNISGKTFTDALTIQEQGSTPSTPASGDKKFYAKNDGKVYTLDSGGNEVEVGSGGGSGSKNYIDTDSAELETSVGSWTTDNGAGSAAAYLTLSQETTVQLAGDGSLKVVKSANDASSEYIKLTTQAIDLTDRGKALFGSFSMDCTDANYASGDFILEIYDNTNAAVLYSGVSEDLELLATKGRFDFVTYTETTTAEIEIRLKVNSTNATSYSLYFDEFKLGPAASVQTIYRKSQTIDFSGDANYTAGIIQAERVGNIVTLTTPTAFTFASASSVTSATVTLPTWAIPDTQACNTYTGTGVPRIFCIETDGKVSFSFGSAQTSSLDEATISYAVADTTGPTLNNNELSLQTISVKAFLTTGSHTSSSTYQTIVYDNEIFDSHNAYNSSTGEFTAPKSGKYEVDGVISFLSNGTGTRYLQVYVNGSADSLLGGLNLAGTGQVVCSGNTTLNLEKGDVVTLRAYQTSGGTLGYATTSGSSSFSIKSAPDYTVLGAVKEKNKIQTKLLSADVTSDGAMSDLTFSNLVIGRWYEFRGKMRLTLDAGAGSATIVYVDAKHNGSVLDRALFQINEAGDSTLDAIILSTGSTFKATATTLTFEAVSTSSNAKVDGGSNQSETYVQLEERNDLIETDEF